MNRRRFLKASLLGAASATLLGTRPGRAADRDVPNIVIILADDLGWADTGCYGADLHETPNLDRLASQGMKFTNAYAAAPVCTPTRASIMTGKSPARLHMTIWHEASKKPPQGRKLIPPVTVANLPHEETTLAEILHDAGYHTAHVGKWHLGNAAHYPETHGFDINIGGTFWGAPSTFFYPYRGTAYKEYRYVPHMEGGHEGEYLTDRLTDEAIRVMENAADRPFFLHLAYHTVHTPIEAKPAVVQYYEKKLKPMMRHQNPTLAAMVHALDENVGRLLAKLDELDVADKTLVLFASDNGGFVGKYQGRTVTNNSPLRSGKGSLYEGGIRVPLLIRWPGVAKPGSVCDEPVATTDFYPTLLEASSLEGDAEHNADLDGLSLVPLLKDSRNSLNRETLFFHYPHYYHTTSPVSAVRHGDWKLLEYFEDDRVELYNLADDLGENHDLAAQKPDLAENLRRRIHDWRKSMDAQIPALNPEHPVNSSI